MRSSSNSPRYCRFLRSDARCLTVWTSTDRLSKDLPSDLRRKYVTGTSEQSASWRRAVESPYTRVLLEEILSVDGGRGSNYESLSGSPPSVTDPPAGCRFHPRCPEFIDGRCVGRQPTLDDVDGDEGHEVACHWTEQSAAERAEHTTPNASERAVIEREVGDDGR